MKQIELGTILHMEKGKKPKLQSKDAIKGYLPYVDIKAFEQGIIDNYASTEKVLLCEDGDLLIVGDGSRSGLTGRAIKGIVGSTLYKIYADGMTTDYLRYFIESKYLLLNTQKKGTGTPHLNANILKKSKLIVPSIEEQERIVAKIEELFSDLDNAVETLNATKTQLEVYRQAVLSDMLCKNTTNSTLEECLISLQNGIAKRSGTYGTPVKVLRLSNITNDSVIADSEMRSINLTTTEQQKYLLDEEDGIFVRVNGSTNRVGRLILINKDKEYAYCDHLIRCKFDTGVVIPKFIKLCLDTQHSRNYMMNNLVSSAGQNTISQTTIRNLPLWIPDLIDQEQIVYEIESRLSVYESIEKTIINTLQQATAMRQSILKQAFEGRLL